MQLFISIIWPFKIYEFLNKIKILKQSLEIFQKYILLFLQLKVLQFVFFFELNLILKLIQNQIVLELK
ncbi:hypothetical protein IMG5_076050 [Ichthyophthirius multifiliis]|uniref:Uncharacterized protein n=1 Tax=Ichthyophthirius multifiliis TaxID=5932 RepID=G0QQ84_ICHMU|nr:hypothetical protein IMG5_076050 [Ichthyophthirius multifiliis]EGR32585.1 hypothetical protein IMG5_076050 [Ichthyophthirius multifiliis]|eukprot:XP_004036571.1 hypothetical protein IMG5_076050 [Ichthyophthirius multifiliis]